MKIKYTIIIILTLLALVGCTTRMSPHETVKHLSKYPVALDVSVGPKLLALEDKASHMGHSIIVPSGMIASRWFRGKLSQPQIELKSSHLSFETRDEFPLPIFHSRADYRISCVLLKGDKKISVSGNGTGKSGIDVKEAIVQAIEEAFSDLADQTSMVINLTQQ